MRTMLWLLLLLNGVAALVWMAGFSLPARPVAEPAAPTPSAKRLQLLSELPAPPQRLDSLPLDGVMAADLTDPGSAIEADTPAPEPAAAPVVEPSIVTLAAPVDAATEPSAPKRALPVTDTAPSTEPGSTQLALSVPDTAAPRSGDAAVCYRTAALAAMLTRPRARSCVRRAWARRSCSLRTGPGHVTGSIGPAAPPRPPRSRNACGPPACATGTACAVPTERCESRSASTGRPMVRAVASASWPPRPSRRRSASVMRRRPGCAGPLPPPPRRWRRPATVCARRACSSKPVPDPRARCVAAA
jgi:hypothetical protein